MNKQEELDKLYEKYKMEHETEEVVLGDGSTDARLLLIGEAPGKDEVRQGKPFVGMAGKNLEEFLRALDIQRIALYITNAIKYRLSEVNPETGRIVNRPAKKEEITSNRTCLLNEIRIINPEYVITLGNVPLKALTGDLKASIGAAHGRLEEITVEDIQVKLYPLYHPASIIYNRTLKEVYLQDIQKLKTIIHPQ